MKTFKHLFTALLLLCATVATAHDFEVGGIYYGISYYENETVYVTHRGEYSISYSNEYTGSVVIPESVIYNGTTYSVTSIGQGAFEYCTSLTSIVIPNSVTSIGNQAFYKCTGLTSVTIPNSVTRIGSFAFEDCTSLTSVVIPNSVKSIEYRAFYGCSGLTSIEIPNSVTSIGNYAFYGCTGLTSVKIPNSVTSIGYGAFDGTAWYNNQPDGVVYAGKVLYKYIGRMLSNTSITITDGTLGIAGGAFEGCSGLTSITIPNSVTSIGDYAFYWCTGLTSIEIPNSVTSIEDYAFSGCTGLTSITIPNSVTFIGKSAFNGCSELTSIEIPNSVTSIGNYAFDGTAWYNNQPDGVVYAGKVLYKYIGRMPSNTSITITDGTLGIAGGAFEGCSRLTSVVIPNSVKSIGSYAFRDCTGLTSIEIPNSVTSIGSSAFYNCTGLKTVYNFSNLTFSKGSSGNGYIAYYADKVYNAPNGSFEGDFIFGKPNDVNTLVGYLGNATEITLPADYKGENYVIGAAVFKGNTTITSIEIGDGVTSIGEWAFYGCKALTSITIPNSVTSIGLGAFQGCSGLTSITIPNSVTSIGNQAFYGCTGLTSVTIPNSVTRIGSFAFEDCTSLTSVVIPNSVKSIEYRAFYGCSGLTSITIPNSVTSIGDWAFRDCTGITSIEIPNSVTSIGNYAFDECTGLKTVYNFSNLTFSKGSSGNGYIAYYADKVYNAPNGSFEGDFIFGKPNDVNTLVGYLGNATEITLPADYKGENYVIGAAVFKGNTTITSIEIGDGVTSIGEWAFNGCTGLTSITIPNSVTSIENSTFQNCSALASVEIPNSITSIGQTAFRNCSSLARITIPSSVTSIGSNAFNGCTGLEKVCINDLAVWCGIDFADEYANPLYYAKNMYLNGELLTELSIPAKVAEVKDYAFYNCKGVTNIDIVNGIKSIGNSAFYGCSDLETLYISNAIESIDDNAFAECNNLFDIMVGSKKAIVASENIFSIDAYNNACLYVPEGRKFAYEKTAPWNKFYIVEMEPVGLPGDINKDGEVNVGDFAALANIIFNSESIDDAIKSVSDINADGEVNVGDFAALVNLIFNSGSQASPNRAATRAAADETTFYIEPFSIAAGDTKVIPVLMENPGEVFSQLQFDITLPEGLEIPEYFDEEQFDDVKAIKHGSRTSQKAYSIQTQPVGEALRVLCITQNSKAIFTGVSGDVLLITVKAADKMAIGDVDIKITNTVLSRQDGTTYKPADCTATVSVTDGTGINDVKEQKTESKDVYYDLSGRAVENPTKGINILNGKKVLVK